MTITTGDRLPAAKFIRMGAEGPQEVSVDALCSGRKIAMFAVPGAFTPTCSSAHVPSFMRVKDALLAKGGLYADFWARQSGGFLTIEENA